MNESIEAISPVDYWWAAQSSIDMPIYDADGVLYCADGWNGEAYLHSFRVLNRFDIDPEHPQEVELWPIYRYEAECWEYDEENADYDNQIVAFEVR